MAMQTVEPDIYDHAYVDGPQATLGPSPNDACWLQERGSNACGLPRWRHQHPEGTEAIWLTERENALLRMACSMASEDLSPMTRARPVEVAEAARSVYEDLHDVWSRLSRMPTVGEK